ncbi:hypothetical protein FN846DRAFT_816632 [Sphaerosporella brunnea]|uniref:MACPF-like domain-containing protein n=1 Tax=Sphaerosporella brunnea TaxID=1250544 RepID=A0A5J5ENY0_9PEZI|nr:hypothetical protein FN846DRAFT_816632 [Sphaerosporella brunnea]
MNETEWDAVLKNSGAFYGWKFDVQNNRIVRARKPAFRLRSGLNMPKGAENKREELKATADKTAADKTAADKVTADKVTADKVTADKAALAKSPPEMDKLKADKKPGSSAGEAVKPVNAKDLTAPVKPNAIPSFVLNDKSSVNVVSVTHEFQESMASNHFDSTSVEASVSGGASGWSVGGTGGVKFENSGSNKRTKKEYGKVLMATYKACSKNGSYQYHCFPRVTLYLNPEDLEPTDELKEALDLIKKEKNIKQLRNLHDTFGHLFCHQVELGGCLETSKVSKADATTTETSEKHQFKAEVGLAVSTPLGIGASTKVSNEHGTGSVDGTAVTDRSERMSFNATGGNTLLAANPPAWTASVVDFNNWRVIERSKLTPLSDAIAGNPQFGKVKQWFVQAVSKLSEYLTVPDSRTIDVRFSLVMNEPLKRVLNTSTPAYLGHYPNNPPKPVKIAVKPGVKVQQKTVKKTLDILFWTVDLTNDVTTCLQPVETQTANALFFPASTQAPVIASPTGDKLGTTADAERCNVVWTIEVPTGNSVGRPDRKEKEEKFNTMMTVYRNQQGVFLPAVSSSDELVMDTSRLDSSRRVGSSHATDGDQLKDGDRVRLCWKFSDQTGGFRDFYEDSYGRRRYTKPKDVASDTLYLKLPFPGFQNQTNNHGASMVLSTDDKKEPVPQTIATLGDEKKTSYSLYDLCFRLDSVGNNGDGDALDFMNCPDAKSHTVDTKLKASAPEEGSPEALMAALIYGANMELYAASYP